MPKLPKKSPGYFDGIFCDKGVPWKSFEGEGGGGMVHFILRLTLSLLMCAHGLTHRDIIS